MEKEDEKLEMLVKRFNLALTKIGSAAMMDLIKETDKINNTFKSKETIEYILLLMKTIDKVIQLGKVDIEKKEE